MNSSLIPPTRTVYIYRKPLLSAEQTIIKEQKLHQLKTHKENEETCPTTNSLARTFINVTNQYQKNENENELTVNLINLAKQICICKRSLQFSNTKFINIWLNHLISGKITANDSSSPLLVYHALTRHTCYLTLGPLIILAEVKWLKEQCNLLLVSSSSSTVYQGKYEIQGRRVLLDEN